MTGAELRSIRLALDLTLAEFGRALGYAPQRASIMVNELEREAKGITPSVERLAEMFRRHGVPKRYLAQSRESV